VSDVIVVLLISQLLLIHQMPFTHGAEDNETYQHIPSPDQDESVADGPSSADSVTFDLPIPLLKSLISGSQSLYQKRFSEMQSGLFDANQMSTLKDCA
jgi:hypothetical protein